MNTGRSWRVAPGTSLSLDEPRLMGVLNVTPDSFSDGGAYARVEPAVDRGLRLVDEGACIIHVGGESVRPGPRRVRAQEPIRGPAPGGRGPVAIALSIIAEMQQQSRRRC